MTLYAKTFPGSDGAAAVRWNRMAATAADHSGDPAARVCVRGRAATALGYEGASLGVADVLTDQALALAERPSFGLPGRLVGDRLSKAFRGVAGGIRWSDRFGPIGLGRPPRRRRSSPTQTVDGSSTRSKPFSPG
ncbi:hypothetical protein [Streptomyces sp. NPDC059874]|uniref:hypothetical protein n=1 Tax=Streptomyces sp. NPDC059874 TaxID=3346983 RepID=UPI00364B23BE